ncbi:unnamed protein product [Lepidochelys olivacea]
MPSGSIYQKCEESDQGTLKEQETEMAFGRAGNSLLQCGSSLNGEERSVLPLNAVNAVSFVLWVILLAMVIGKCKYPGVRLGLSHRNGPVEKTRGEILTPLSQWPNSHWLQQGQDFRPRVPPSQVPLCLAMASVKTLQKKGYRPPQCVSLCHSAANCKTRLIKSGHLPSNSQQWGTFPEPTL